MHYALRMVIANADNDIKGYIYMPSEQLCVAVFESDSCNFSN